METSFVPREHRHLVELAALLPQRVIENLVAQRRLGKQAKPGYAAKHMEAALLFIDISGFTASMEMFAQQGSKGIEKFWKMFNAYFCDLLDVIQVCCGPQPTYSDIPPEWWRMVFTSTPCCYATENSSVVVQHIPSTACVKQISPWATCGWLCSAYIAMDAIRILGKSPYVTPDFQCEPPINSVSDQQPTATPGKWL